MKKIILGFLLVFLVLTTAGCTSSKKQDPEETRAADDKNWPTKTEVAFMEDVPKYSATADRVTINKTAINTNEQKEITYSEIVLIEYKSESVEDIVAYIDSLTEKGYLEDKDTSTSVNDSKFSWNSISGSAVNDLADYSLPYIELSYDKAAEYNFIIKIAIF